MKFNTRVFFENMEPKFKSL